MDCLHFNRHEIFDTMLMDRVHNVLNAVQDHDIDTDGKLFGSLCNMLFGLYDGYLYDDLQMQAMSYPFPIYSECVDIVSEILKRIQVYENQCIDIQIH
jgi:hypothetical protein